MQDRIQQAKANYSLEQVAHRLGLKTETRAGELYACCVNPNHDDKHPSMHLATRGRYAGKFKCWSCGDARGDVVDLVAITLGIKTSAALDWLDGQSRAAPMPKAAPRVEKEAPALNEDLHPFAFQAHVERTDEAARWLAQRGLAPVMDTFFLGSTDAPGFPVSLLPDKWDPETGRIYKHKNFRNRLVIPHLMPDGSVPYVNARALADQKPKYLKASRPQGGSIPPYLLHLMLEMGADQLFITEGECFPGSTEVLTPTGWIRLDEYAGQDVMQVGGNPLSPVGTFVRPLAYVNKEYEGDMVTMQNRFLSMTMTTNHQMAYVDYKGRWAKKPAHEFAKRKLASPKGGDAIPGSSVPDSFRQGLKKFG